ncbi:MAG: 23S rRNA (pseudouridine(1915)-N(3))-methyltransferase RlmH [Synergistetes bacterium]|nr:23S rRNA (pseudouridine(1915)-N(3))-methyltransferase RlmH [Synergistota bacterium]
MAYRIRVVAVGKIRQSFYKDAINEYLKRLKPLCRISIDEIPESGDPETEGKKILKALRERDFLIALDERGEMITSMGLSQKLEELFVKGREPVFILGGIKGLSEEVRKRVSCVWSLSRLTFTHELARVILFEQIYRAFKIMRKEPYHY